MRRKWDMREDRVKGEWDGMGGAEREGVPADLQPASLGGGQVAGWRFALPWAGDGVAYSHIRWTGDGDRCLRAGLDGLGPRIGTDEHGMGRGRGDEIWGKGWDE